VVGWSSVATHRTYRQGAWLGLEITHIKIYRISRSPQLIRLCAKVLILVINIDTLTAGLDLQTAFVLIIRENWSSFRGTGKSETAKLLTFFPILRLHAYLDLEQK
jgi:hypothetical protein